MVLLCIVIMYDKNIICIMKYNFNLKYISDSDLVWLML